MSRVPVSAFTLLAAATWTARFQLPFGTKEEVLTVARCRIRPSEDSCYCERPLPCRDSGRAGGAASQQNPFNHWPQLAFELRDARIKVNSADPGFTATDLNQHRGYQTVEQGASEAVRLALLPADGRTGGFFSTAGRDPW